MLKILLEKVKKAEAELGDDDIYWYRGHNNSEFQLLPSFYRKGQYHNEANIFYDFKNFSASLNPKRSNWEIVLDMQHYGVPTRLLDWTANLGAALFFAIDGCETDAALWVLSPFSLNKASVDLNYILDVDAVSDSEAGEYEKFTIHDLVVKNKNIATPFAIEPSHCNRRLAAQRGAFTAHGYYKYPIESMFPDSVRKITIPKDDVADLKEQVRILGIDHFLLFPDYEGLAKHIKNKYAL